MLGDTDPLGGPDATLRIGCVAELALRQVQPFVGAPYASARHLEATSFAACAGGAEATRATSS